MKKMTVQFYALKNAGLYRYGDSPDQEPIAAGHHEIWEQLYSWIQGIQDFSNTSTYGKNEKPSVNRTFCLNIARFDGTNELLLTTWNEVPNNKSGVGYINANAQVGQNIQVNSANMGADAIPGYPSYFWIIPNERVVASLKLQEAYNLIGTRNLHFYMKSFLEKFSDPVCAVQDERMGNVDYEYIIDGHVTSCTPRFDLVLKRETNCTQHLVQRFASLKKIIRKSTINNELARDDYPAFFDNAVRRITEIFGAENALPENDITTWSIEANYTPQSKEEFHRVIDNFVNEARQNGDIDSNMGLLFSGSQTPEWIYNNVLKIKDISCNPVYTNNKEFILDQTWLAQLINSRRHELLAKLRE